MTGANSYTAQEFPARPLSLDRSNLFDISELESATQQGPLKGLTYRNITIYTSDMARRKKQMDHSAWREAAECLKLLGHPQRLMLLDFLLFGRHSVGELAGMIGAASHVVSEHLRSLERCGFLRAEREGRQTFYRVSDTHIAALLECVRSRFAA